MSTTGNSKVNYRGRSKRLELQLRIALSLLTKMQRAQYDKAYYKVARKKANERSKLIVRREFKGHVPTTGKPQSDRMDLGE